MTAAPERRSAATPRTVRQSIAVSSGAALVAVGLGLLTARVAFGLAAAVGLSIGSVNGFLIQRSVALGIGFTVLSLGRLFALSAVGLAAGFLIGPRMIWVVIAGMALAQLLLVAVAVRETLAR